MTSTDDSLAFREDGKPDAPVEADEKQLGPPELPPRAMKGNSVRLSRRPSLILFSLVNAES